MKMRGKAEEDRSEGKESSVESMCRVIREGSVAWSSSWEGEKVRRRTLVVLRRRTGAALSATGDTLTRASLNRG